MVAQHSKTRRDVIVLDCYTHTSNRCISIRIVCSGGIAVLLLWSVGGAILYHKMGPSPVARYIRIHRLNGAVPGQHFNVDPEI